MPFQELCFCCGLLEGYLDDCIGEESIVVVQDAISSILTIDEKYKHIMRDAGYLDTV